MERAITVVEARNYLVKGCAPQIFSEGKEFPIDHEGPVNQRRWQVVSSANRVFRSQRHKGYNRLCLVRPALHGGTLTLSAPQMEDCVVDVHEEGEKNDATIWDATVPVFDHPEASQWMSDFLHQQVRFVRQAGNRPINSIYAPEESTVAFADRFPLTAVSEATLKKIEEIFGESAQGDRFRYNILLKGLELQEEHRMEEFEIGSSVLRGAKPCGRCTTINVNKQTGEADLELFSAMKESAAFRNPSTGEPIVSENLLVEKAGRFTVGDAVHVSQWREEGWDRPYQKNHLRKQTLTTALNAFKSVGLGELWRTIRGK